MPPSTTLAVGGLTETEAIGIGATVTVDFPVFPSLVAVISAVPGATAVTTPSADTVATKVVDEDQATTRPVRTFPFASRVTADAWVVWPTVIDAEASDTPTEATG